MSGDEQRDRLAAIIREESIRRGNFTLASGKTSDYYLDCRRTTLHAEGAVLVGRVALEELDERGWRADAVGGLTLGADPISTAISITSQLEGRPMHAFLVRKAVKGHGTGQKIERCPPAGSRVVVVEDVVTSGGSLIQAVEASREAGLEVVGALTIVDRQEGGAEAIEALGLPYAALYTAGELLGR